MAALRARLICLTIRARLVPLVIGPFSALLLVLSDWCGVMRIKLINWFGMSRDYALNASQINRVKPLFLAKMWVLVKTNGWSTMCSDMVINGFAPKTGCDSIVKDLSIW